MSKYGAKKVTIDGITFDSAVDAAEAVKMQPHMLRQVARGERKPPKGFEIKYVEESGEEVIG